MLFYRQSIWVFACILALHRLSAQPDLPFAARYICEEIDGLLGDIVTGVTQDGRGLMWFLSLQKGLVRYDGARMTLFPSSRRGKLPVLDNRYYGLAAAPDGFIWVATRFGVERFDPVTQAFSPVVSPGADWDLSFEQEALAVLLDDQGNMWVAFGSCLLLFERCDPLKPILVGRIPSGDYIRQISIDKQGQVWLAGPRNQIYRVKDRQIIQEKSIALQHGDAKRFIAFLHDAQGRLTGFHCAKTGQYFDLLPDGSLLTQIPADAVSRESLQKDWDKYKFLTRIVGNQSNYFDMGLRVYKDPQGRSWAYGIGIFVLSPVGLHFTTQPQFADIEFRGMLEHQDGSLFMCTYNGVFRYFHDKNRLDTLIKQLSSARHPMAVWNQELILLTENNGVFSYNLETGALNTDPFGMGPAGSKMSFLTYTIDKQGRYWIGSPQMGYLQEGQKRWFTDPKWQRPHHSEVRAMYLDHQGVFWIGTESGLFTFTEKSGWGPVVTSVDGALHQQTRINYIWQDAEGMLWIGTMRQGILKFDPKKRAVVSVFDEKSGLGADVTYINAENGGEILWVVCFDGIYQLEVATGKTVRFAARMELPVQEFNHAATLKLRDGAYMSGGVGGCIRFVPGEGLLQHQIPVFPKISQITFLSNRNKDARIIEFPEQNSSITLEAHEHTMIVLLGNGDYAVPMHRKRHAVWLEGFEKDWTVLQNLDQFRYTNLPAGKYVLHLKVLDRNTFENSPETRILIVVRESFYRSAYFPYLILLLVGLLAFLAYRYRIRQIRNEQRFRLNLSSNLHDELGGILFKINHLAHEIADKSGDDPAIRKKANLLTDFCRKTYQAMGDIIWSLNIDKQTVGDLLDRMQDNVDAMLKSEHIPVQFQHNNLHLNKKLNINTRHHILLIFKECLTNIVKHTTSRAVHISLLNEGGVFTMTIENTFQERRNGAPSGGNGLSNMQFRAGQIKGKLQIEQSDERFSVLLTLPYPL